MTREKTVQDKEPLPEKQKHYVRKYHYRSKQQNYSWGSQKKHDKEWNGTGAHQCPLNIVKGPAINVWIHVHAIATSVLVAIKHSHARCDCRYICESECHCEGLHGLIQTFEIFNDVLVYANPHKHQYRCCGRADHQ